MTAHPTPDTLRREIKRLVGLVYRVRARDVEVMHGFIAGVPGFDSISVEITVERDFETTINAFETQCRHTDTETQALSKLLRTVRARCRRIAREVRT